MFTIFVPMGKIDTDIYVTQQALANELNITVQCVHNWIKRGKINSLIIEGSRLTLVDKTSVQPDKRRNK